MKNILFDISGKIEKIGLNKVNALYEVKKVADSLKIPFFVVGASARDFILEHCYNIKSPRMTEDIDLGVEVADWDKFNKLSETLLSTGKFSKAPEKQRFLFRDVFIDIVPFGPIAGKDKKISWPPEHEIFMNILGFEEAYEYSITLRLGSKPELDIKFPTLSGLAIMKIISWKEEYPERKTDAEDLLFIMKNYEVAGNEERLYGQALSLLEEEDFDTRLAGIRLLGRDIAKISDSQTLKAVKEILEGETGEQSRYRLVEDIVSVTFMYSDQFDEILNYVEKLKEGISEK
ncbi:MAG: nucleotidyl transferase AbiEii/AbiGii toxin family protein [Actinobacteria bacterium]|nr:nucleotidyl transferase AbiEii/AbiGii toxin family protein [Actinomycetota bacterium]